MAVIEKIWSKRAHRGVMDELREATLVAGAGMHESTRESKRRQLTLLARESWDAALRELGVSVDPSARRANILVSGIDLEQTRGRVLRIGECRLAVGGELTPCERMEEAARGLRAALRPHWRGGVFAQVLTGGTIRVKDLVVWED